ncbi:MAG: class I SAM-dependent methyltransferase [Myxococcales bacterium]|nr:MAG: class I SAM-dependent methyltransferase [Myxococcales bacterium]
MLCRMTDAPKPSPLASPEPWNLVADDYAIELLPMFELFSKDALKLAPTHAGAKVLDVACGPGTLTLLAAEAGCSVSSLDFSPQMVRNLKRRLNGAQQGADVREGDGQALPWGDGEFDAAFSMFGLMFFPDRAKGFSELHRVLKPGGAAVVSSWAPFEGIFVSIMSAVREVLPDIPFGSGKGPLGDPDEFASELRGAGFSEVSVQPITHILPGDTPAEFWAQTQRTTAPVVLLKNRLGEAEWRRVTQGVVERLEAQYGKDPVEVKTTAYLGFGRKS